jgi:hypothetical protein
VVVTTVGWTGSVVVGRNAAGCGCGGGGLGYVGAAAAVSCGAASAGWAEAGEERGTG